MSKDRSHAEWWMNHPPHERAEITDRDTGESLGTISNQDLRFLIDRFEEQGMEGNDFYFTSELFEMFDEVAKPGRELKEFIRNVLENREDVELHWHDKSSVMATGIPRWDISPAFWPWFALLFSIGGGVIVLFYGFRTGIGGPVERALELRIIFGCLILLPGVLILYIYWDLKRDVILRKLFSKWKKR